MITYQAEAYSDCIEDMKKHYEEHYNELSVTKSFPLEMDYDTYFLLEKAGKLKVVTCRKDEILIGYIIFIINGHLHYKSCVTAVEDIYYVAKQERKGRVGIKLFQYAEQYLKSIGVQRIMYSTKVHLDNSKLFEYLGYTFIEKLYNKMI
jgi:GNAT superfamily N-acetyltransferase